MLRSSTEITERFFYFFLFVCVVLYALNLRLDVMEVDAAQYASIGAEMLRNGSWLQVYHKGSDYLDKPPLLFWCNAASMYVFGVHTFSAKLPGMLALCVSLFALYRFCLVWYTLSVARLSVLVLATSQAFFLMSNDVKTDGLLMACLLCSLWAGSVYLKTPSWKALIAFSFALSLAMMAKGPLGFLLPVAAFGIHLTVKKEWGKVMNLKTTAILPLIAMFLFPMCWGLYEQFDLHPEKEVYGLQGPSGLRFFFWTQSFGRLTGEIYWKNDAPWYFFFLSMLWDFAPWVIFFWIFLVDEIKNNRLFQAPEQISLALFFVGMFGFSASQYKLPHYIFPLFGGCALLVARNLVNRVSGKSVQTLLWIFTVLFLLVPWLGVSLLFPAGVGIYLLLVLIAAVVYGQGVSARNPLQALLLSLAGFGFVLALWFYPSLLHFQSSSQAGKYVFAHKRSGEKLFAADASGHALDFYARQNSLSFSQAGSGDWLYASSSFGDSLLLNGGWKLVQTFPDYPVSRLSGKFLFDKNRENHTSRRMLLQKE